MTNHHEIITLEKFLFLVPIGSFGWNNLLNNNSFSGILLKVRHFPFNSHKSYKQPARVRGMLEK